MFFYVAKIGFFLLRPSNFMALLLVLGFLCFGVKLPRLGFVCLGLGTLGFLLAGFSPLPNMLMVPLEDRFPPAELPSKAPDGIIVLGGAFDTTITGTRPYPGLTSAAERLTIVPELARRYPHARIIHTGGSGLLLGSRSTEADGAKRVFSGFGLDPDRILLEDKSRNTWQNAVFTRRLLQPKTGQTWLLVTSAGHMPRAMGTFRKAGWSGLIPCPVDWRTRGSEDLLRFSASASDGLKRFDIAVREWLGLVAYRLSDRTGTLFPGPKAQS